MTGCFVDLFDENNYLGFPSLEDLEVWSCNLSREDADIIWRGFYSGKLPQLHSLRISFNDLADSVRLLNQNNVQQSPVLPLQKLTMAETKLSSSDIANLSKAVAVGKLPNLQYLSMRLNNFSFMGEDIKELVLSCKSKHPQTKLQIDLRDIDLPQNVREEIRFQCLGTCVEIVEGSI